MKKLKNLGKIDLTIEVELFEGGKKSKVYMNSRDLVPGDVIILKHYMIIPCDGVIIEGSVVVNESMLTGESIPINKESI